MEAQMGNGSAPEIKIPETMWKEFVPRIQAEIISEYEQLPDKSPANVDQNVDWMRAFLIYIRAIEYDRKSRSSWIHENITGIMVFSAVMALAFGVLGVWGLSAGGNLKDVTSGFLDIAKLFAGALVGAAGATAAIKR
jgi:hypothetical protein